ncbi:MAG: EamA family transporter [Chloroflexia bacterium]|nr:EamA family transporter [Chloroflexia bacterium]
MFGTEESLLGRRVGRARSAAAALPPTVLIILAIFTTQLGAAIAKGLFQTVGPGGTVFVRVGFAALVLLVLWRPRLGGYARADYAAAVVFGLVLGGMNLAFYSALNRIPLGIAVTLEFVGPLGVAVFGSRRALDLLWVVLAGAGVLLLSPVGGADLDVLGASLALTAGGLWAAYILLSARVGRAFPGGSGLVIAMLVAAGMLTPVGLLSGGTELLAPSVLVTGLGVALLSAAIPYSLELAALRRLPAHVFGVMMSLQPAAGALVGLVILNENIGLRGLSAVALVTIATVGATRSVRE